MDDSRQRITEDLSGLLRGEIRCDPLALTMYASDGSLYQIAPLGVVFPKNRQDVINLAHYSAETNIPLIARGAGSGVAGESLGNGLIVDFTRHMRDIERVDADTVRIQPGVVLDSLNRVLREYGRYFPPDPAGSEVTTIGSMLALDAAGSHAVRVGSTRDHVRSAEVILAGGVCFEAENESLDILRRPPRPVSGAGVPGEPVNRSSAASADAKRTIISKLAKLLSDNELLINERQPTLMRNRCGYYLRGIVTDDHLNLVRLLVGSEGTLALFTAATLHTSPLPAHRGVVLLLFGQLESAIRAVCAIASQQPSACDLLDRRLLTLARESDARFADLIAPSAEAALLVEQTGFSDKQVRDRIAMAVSSARSLVSSVAVAREAYAFDDVEFLWSLPRTVVPLLTRLRGRTRPLPFVEDVAVPPESLYEFLVRAQKVFQKHEVTASLYAHAASGQLHLRPFVPQPQPGGAGSIESIARDLYQVVFAVGGTISGEHGVGLSRTAFIRSQYGPLYRVFQQVKDIFDPHNLLNPGKIISDDPHLTIKNIRPANLATTANLVDLQLRWSGTEMAQAAAMCNGCARCKTQEAGLRMCPFFRMNPTEEASPRSKANVMRSLATGILTLDDLASPELKQLGSLCFNCKQCEIECPTNVDIPHLMIEAKAAYVAANGLSRADWILTRAQSSASLGCTLSWASNWAINNPVFRWLLEKSCGISRHRKLPPFARRSFLRSMRRGTGHRNSDAPTVAYFVDHYANFHDPELAQAFVAILKHNGLTVQVPPGQISSGMALISAGDLDAARDVALKNVRELAEPAREGVPIVCTEPAAAVCLKHEYPKLLDHPDVDVVASQVVEAGDFLTRLHQKGRLRTDFCMMDLRVGYHTPCHLKALSDVTHFRNLMTLIPGLQVNTINEGCSGMAGAYGFSAQNFQTSIRIGWRLITRMRKTDIDVGVTECSSCKIQMEQGSSAATIHPLKLMALAYGLMPEMRQRLRRSRRRLTVT